MENTIALKKRGRKPKNRTDEEIRIAEEEKIKKKRGRKPTGKIYEINKTLISNMASTTPNCIIAHLPLSEKDINNIIGKMDDDLIDINDEIIDDKLTYQTMSSYSSFVIEADDNLKYKYDDKCKELDECKKKYEDLIEKFKKFTYLEDKISDNGMIEKKYYVSNSNIFDVCGNCWKDHSESRCWWCSHEFDTVPVGLPNKYQNNKFYLYGCFCSFNCAHSYNLELKDYKIWERYSLLNYIKKIVFKNDTIQNITSAPPKQVLQIYGGTLTIEEFRNSSIVIPKEYYHMMPPMIPIFSVVEEIPKFFHQMKGNKNNGNFGELKIKRTKPLALANNNLLNLFNK
jgi:hypothetical protein